MRREELVLAGSLLAFGLASSSIGLGLLGILESGFGSIHGFESMNGEPAQRLGYALLAVGMAFFVAAVLGFRYAIPRIGRERPGKSVTSLRDELREHLRKLLRKH